MKEPWWQNTGFLPLPPFEATFRSKFAFHVDSMVDVLLKFWKEPHTTTSRRPSAVVPGPCRDAMKDEMNPCNRKPHKLWSLAIWSHDLRLYSAP